MKFGFNRLSSFLGKKRLKTLKLIDLEPRSMNDTDLSYSYRSMFSLSILHIPTLIQYYYSLFYLFPIQNHKGPNLN